MSEAADARQLAEASGRLASYLRLSERVVVFTGAGASTESGIPDFRSPGGVWSRMKPIPFQQFVASEEARREAWRRVFSGAAGWTGASPNAGHRAIARLIESGTASVVITQNVDNLHQDSGVPEDRLIELHGNASYAKCLSCGSRYELEPLRAPFLETGAPPNCRWCGGPIKTATISFGQAMPEAAMARAEAEAKSCDLFLVLGSSLVVYPAASLPLTAREHGAELVIVNREPTDQDPFAGLVLRQDIGPLLTRAVEQALGPG